jgi:hypothetical protein
MDAKSKRELVLHLNRRLQETIYPNWQQSICKRGAITNNLIKQEIITAYTNSEDLDINQQYLPVFLELYYPLAEVLFRIDELAFQSAKRIVGDLLAEVKEYENC